jgi:CarD family transcriptional regulator
MIDDKLMIFQELLVLSNGGKLFVPIENLQTIGMRPLLNKSEIPKLLDRLKESTASAKDWRERTQENLQLLSSGSAFALAEVVASLTELSETRTLTSGDSRVLERARLLLTCEISEVTGETRRTTEQEIDNALRARTEQEVPRLESAIPSVGTSIGTAMQAEARDLATPQAASTEPPPTPHKLRFNWPWSRR